MRALHCWLFALLICVAAVVGCSGNSSTTMPHGGPTPNAGPTRCPAANYTCIQHVVVIIQENRSFNNLFMGYPGALTRTYGFAGTKPVPILQRTLQASIGDISHCWEDAMAAWDGGKMDHFDLEHAESFPIANCPSLFNDGDPVGTSGRWSPYVFVPHDGPDYVKEAGPYWKMAMQYVLADHYFPTDFGPSFTAHQYLVAGTTDLKRNLAVVNYPGYDNHQGGVGLSANTSWSCNSIPAISRTSTLDAHRRIHPLVGPTPCFTTYRTIADSLDAKSISWQYFTESTGKRDACPECKPGDYIWSPFSSIAAVRYGPDWRNVVNPATKIFDAAGHLKSVTWVVPDGRWSDHSGPYVTDMGPSWVADIVNAIGKSPQWYSTAIIVVWDDWGGLYDPVPPPQMDFRGLGIRTPLIIISPYALKGKVSKTVYEPGSILKFIETVFSLPPIAGSCGRPISGSGYTDCRANNLRGFNFSQMPRSFTTIKAPYPESTFTSNVNAIPEPPDNE